MAALDAFVFTQPHICASIWSTWPPFLRQVENHHPPSRLSFLTPGTCWDRQEAGPVPHTQQCSVFQKNLNEAIQNRDKCKLEAYKKLEEFRDVMSHVPLSSRIVSLRVCWAAIFSP